MSETARKKAINAVFGLVDIATDTRAGFTAFSVRSESFGEVSNGWWESPESAWIATANNAAQIDASTYNMAYISARNDEDNRRKP